ncbi:MAG: hypothetical protein QXG00_07360 [Candidatus Woesearchaeota archaeon]
MDKIKYNVEFFDILKDLISISNSVIIKKENDKVVVRRADKEVTIAYSLKAPLDYFDFPSTNEDVTFYNYGEFYQYFKSFTNPDIFVDKMKITMNEGNSKIEYVLQNPESFEKKIPKEPNFTDEDISFHLSPSDHEEIIKMITLIKPKKARLVGDSKKINVVIFNQLHDNQFEKTFNVTKSNGNAEVDFLIFSDTFIHIPPKREYSFNIKSAGFLKVSMLNNKMSLDIYTGKVKTN